MDYVLGNENIWERLKRMDIKDRTQSDHFPDWIKFQLPDLGKGCREKLSGGVRKRKRNRFG